MSSDQGTATTHRGRVADEIKHDGFRVVARKDGERVRLYSRPRQPPYLPVHA